VGLGSIFGAVQTGWQMKPGSAQSAFRRVGTHAAAFGTISAVFGATQVRVTTHPLARSMHSVDQVVAFCSGDFVHGHGGIGLEPHHRWLRCRISLGCVAASSPSHLANSFTPHWKSTRAPTDEHLPSCNLRP